MSGSGLDSVCMHLGGWKFYQFIVVLNLFPSIFFNEQFAFHDVQSRLLAYAQNLGKAYPIELRLI